MIKHGVGEAAGGRQAAARAGGLRNKLGGTHQQLHSSQVGSAVGVNRAARRSACRIAAHGIGNSMRTERLDRTVSARDCPEREPCRHSGNSLMHPAPTQGNCKFCGGLPRDIIHKLEMHQLI